MSAPALTPGRSLAVVLATVVLAVALLTPAPATAAGTWRQTGSLTQGRTEHTATPLADGRVLVAGGRNSSPTASAELYDPATEAWAPTGPLKTARSAHTATLLAPPGCGSSCGKVLLVGGTGSPPSAELYDPATGASSLTAPPGTARGNHTATLLRDGRVLVTGGFGSDGRSSAFAEVYDPAGGAGAGSWTTVDPMGNARAEHTATLLSDGKVLVAGGVDRVGMAEPDVYLDSAEVFDPATGHWSPTAPLAVARALHTATALPDGTVLAAGGSGGQFAGPRRSAEIYDPAAGGGAGAWRAAASMAAARSAHAAALLPDGAVLVAGGQDLNSAPGSSAERYDPAADRWSFTGGVKTGRFGHTAVLLGGPGCAGNCGKVLVAGGVGQGGSFLASAELFELSTPSAPSAVSNLVALAISQSEVRLTFSAVGSIETYPPPAGRYVIKQSTTPITDEGRFDRARPLCGGTCTFSPQNVNDQITVNVTALLPKTTYYYAVKAQDDDGHLGPRSNTAGAATGGPPAERVSDLSARALSARTVRLSFSAAGSAGRASPPARRYEVWQSTAPLTSARRFARARRLCGGTCRLSPRRVGQRLALRVTGLRPRTTYYYALRAQDDAGSPGPVSNVARARTRRDTIAPGGVRRLSARRLSTTSIRLSFAAPGSDGRFSPPTRSYVIKQSRVPITSARRFRRAHALCRRGLCRFAPSRVGARISLTVTGLRRRTTYYYAVMPRDGAGNRGPRSRSVRASTATRGRRRVR